METSETQSAAPQGRRLLTLSLGTLGIVYGDIGTSPLYAIRECFFGRYGINPTPANVLGVLSLIFWSLILVISIKYLLFILRADNRGEGGILSLMALARTARTTPAVTLGLTALGLFGAALLYGDGMITPAISVLSAVEGLHVVTPLFEPFVIPITIAILVGLFLFQHQGTARIGAVFGPVMLIWFLILALLGARAMLVRPEVLLAVNPLHALAFFEHNRLAGFLTLGAVFLVTTGGEALYADMGHFGRKPIRITWHAIVLPALLLNYFGQGALLLGDAGAARNPFYRLAPDWAVLPLVILATGATIIASQAVISGCFSLTRQAIQLGFSPRLEVLHTSSEEIGQIYIGPINWMLMVASVGLVIGFGSSSELAAAYGVAVSTTMVITSLLFYLVARQSWGWNPLVADALVLAFLVVDLAYFGANIIKIEHGGWFALAVAAAVFTLMSTWKEGRRVLTEKLRVGLLAVELFLNDLTANPQARVPGTAVFLTANPEGIPSTLLHNLKHNKVLHQRIVLLTVITEQIPYVPDDKRLAVVSLGNELYRIIAHYGFKESPHMLRILSLAKPHGLEFDLMETTFFTSHETLVPASRPAMAAWRRWLFAFMLRNAQRPSDFFRIPPNRVVDIGAQIEL